MEARARLSRLPGLVFLFATVAAACAAPRAVPGGIPLERDPGPASTRPLPPELAPPHGADPFRVMVELREQVDLVRLASRHRRERLGRTESRRRTLRALSEVARRGRVRIEPLLSELEARGLMSAAHPIRFRSLVLVTVRHEAIAPLRAHPAVAALIPEYDSLGAGAQIIVEPRPVPPGDSWAIDAINARGPWSRTFDGRGIVIGILDSGVDAGHAALAAGRHAGAFWLDPDGTHEEPLDTVPHGTAVLSCAAGRPVEGRAVGAAPGASWAAALANVNNGYNNVRMALAGDWMLFEVQPDVLLGAWGHGAGSCDDRDGPLVAALRAAGTVTVFAAGNGGPVAGTGQPPATLTGLAPDGLGPLAVGALDRNGRVIDASSRGPRTCGGSRPFPDLVAPGWRVPVPDPTRRLGLTLASGTSMAVGFVGGVAAMVVQAAPEMTVPEIEELLRRTARDVGPRGPDDASGFGLVDARAAVDAAVHWAPGRDASARLAPFGIRQRDWTFVSSIAPSGARTTRGGGARRTREGLPAER